MAFAEKASQEVEKVRPYLEGVAKNLVDRLYGADGPAWGTKLAELEDVVVGIRQALSESMLARALERQAQTEARPESCRRCPGCGGAVQEKPGGREPQPRRVLTRGGVAEWVEPEAYCRSCRRSFFPSEQKPGD